LSNSLSRPEIHAIEEATRWLLRARETLSVEEQAALLRWLRALPENAAAMDIVARSWDLSADGAHTKAMGPDLLRAQRLSVTRHQDPRGRPRVARIRAWATLGVIVVTTLATLAGVAWGVMSVNAIYATGRGDQLSAELRDGTRVRLDASTRLEVSFDPFRRRVRMVSGEAEFDVGKDWWRPFRLDTQDVQVRDRGTRFTTRRRGATVRVVLIQGQVELRDSVAGKLLARLAPGEQVTITDNRQVSIERADMGAVLAWRDGRLALKNTSLAEALEEFRARTPVEISLADPTLGQLKISGLYDVADAPGFIDAICTLYHISSRKVGPEHFEIFRDVKPAGSQPVTTD
jgi:transmembrane sensor